MKIIIIQKIPLEQKHGIEVGLEFEVLREEGGGYWIKGNTGEEVKVWHSEVKEIK